MPLGISWFPDTWRPHYDTAVAWHFPCSDAFSREDLLLDTGKPAARQGRKVTGQVLEPDSRTTEEGCPIAPRSMVGLPAQETTTPGTNARSAVPHAEPALPLRGILLVPAPGTA